MNQGIVKGAVWATKKDRGLLGQTLLEVQLSDSTVVACDRVGAGQGDRVLVAFGAAARTEDAAVPTDASVVAILDS